MTTKPDPGVLGPLLDAIESSGVTNLPSLRTVISSGMRFSDAVKARLHDLGTIRLLDSYHCSRYNTSTKRLTPAMFHAVFKQARTLLG